MNWIWPIAAGVVVFLFLQISEHRGYEAGVRDTTTAWATELSHFDCVRKTQ